jgi:hypothetical protein
MPATLGRGADAQVRAVLGRVMVQRRSAGSALDYARELAPGVKANRWALAEAAGHSHTRAEPTIPEHAGALRAQCQRI